MSFNFLKSAEIHNLKQNEEFQYAKQCSENVNIINYSADR